MGLNQLDILAFEMHADPRTLAESARQFRMGEPSGMLVAIARVARFTQATAGRIERWARRPANAAYLPRIPVR